MYSQLVKNPETGEIRHITSLAEYQALGDEWKQSAPTINELQEAYGSTASGGINYGDKTSEGKFRSSFADSVVVANTKKAIASGQKDVAESLIKSVGEERAQNVLETIKADAQKSGGQYYANPSEIVSQTSQYVKFQTAMAPYATTGDDGKTTYNVTAAINGGVDENIVKQLYTDESGGFNQEAYDRAKLEAEYPSYRFGDLRVDSSAIAVGAAPTLDEIKAMQQVVDPGSPTNESVLKAIDGGHEKALRFVYGNKPIDAIKNSESAEEIGGYEEFQEESKAKALEQIQKSGGLEKAVSSDIDVAVFEQAGYDPEKIQAIRDARGVIEEAGGVNAAIDGDIAIDIFEQAGYNPEEIQSTREARSVIEQAGGLEAALGDSNINPEVFEQANYLEAGRVDEFRSQKEELAPYTKYEPAIGPFIDESKRWKVPVGYDINAYTSDKLAANVKPEEIKRTLAGYNFDQKQVNEVVDNIVSLKAVSAEIDGMLLKNRGDYYSAPVEALGDAIRQVSPNLIGENVGSTDVIVGHGGMVIPINRDADGDAITEAEYQRGRWEALSDSQKLEVAAIWAEDSNKGSMAGRMAAEIKDEIIPAAWETGKYMLPVYGTYLTAKERGIKDPITFLSAAADLAIVVPFVRGVSIGVKSGGSFGGSLVRQAGVVAEGELLGPLTLLSDPVGSFKAITAPFASFIPASKNLPLASLYRGTYGNMSISKVVAGADPLAVRKAMQEAEQAMIAGSKSGKVAVDGGGYLHYSSAGLQKELPGTVISTTPYGASFKNTGLVAEGEGVWTAPSAYLGLERQTAYGKTAFYGFNGKEFLGIIDDNRNLLNDHSRVIGKVEGSLEQGAKIIGSNGKKIGTVKQQPAFVMIRTNGMQALPEWAADAKTINQLEHRAWSEFGSGKYADDLYPVFKQYSHWIEEEGLLPRETRLIPVFDNKGNQVILKTRDAVGNVIEVPMMQLVNKRWLQIAQKTTGEMKPVLDILEPKMSVKQMLTEVVDLPAKELINTKVLKVSRAKDKVADVLVEWFRKNPDARMVGSTVEYLHTGKHIPFDVDMGAANPWKAADEIAGAIKKETGIDIDVIKNRDGSSRLEWTNKDGLKTEMANIKHIDDSYDTTVIDGIRMETMHSQLQRTLKRMQADFSGKGYLRFNRFLKSVGSDVDLGIGAKPPTWQQIEKMRLRGWKNTVTDIFNKDLKLDTRVKAAQSLDDNIAGDVKQLAVKEKKFDDLIGEQSKTEKVLADVRKARVDDAGELRLSKGAENALREIRREYKFTDDIITNRSSALAGLNRKLKALNEDIKNSRAELSHQQEKINTELERADFIERSAVRSLTNIYGDEYLRDSMKVSGTARKAPDSYREDEISEVDRYATDRAADEESSLRTVTTPIAESDRAEIDENTDRVDIPEMVDRRDDRREDRREAESSKDNAPPHPGLDTPYFIKEVEGLSKKPVTVVYQRGSVGARNARKPVWVEAKLPGSIEGRGTKPGVKVTFEIPPDAPRKKGTPRQTLFTRGKGAPPKKLVIDAGAFEDTIKRGKIFSSSRERSSPSTYRRTKRGIIAGKEKAVMRGNGRRKRRSRA